MSRDQPRMEFSGARSSCPSASRNSSFSRPLRSASMRAARSPSSIAWSSLTDSVIGRTVAAGSGLHGHPAQRTHVPRCERSQRCQHAITDRPCAASPAARPRPGARPRVAPDRAASPTLLDSVPGRPRSTWLSSPSFLTSALLRRIGPRTRVQRRSADPELRAARTHSSSSCAAVPARPPAGTSGIARQGLGRAGHLHDDLAQMRHRRESSPADDCARSRAARARPPVHCASRSRSGSSARSPLTRSHASSGSVAEMRASSELAQLLASHCSRPLRSSCSSRLLQRQADSAHRRAHIRSAPAKRSARPIGARMRLRQLSSEQPADQLGVADLRRQSGQRRGNLRIEHRTHQARRRAAALRCPAGTRA